MNRAQMADGGIGVELGAHGRHGTRRASVFNRKNGGKTAALRNDILADGEFVQKRGGSFPPFYFRRLLSACRDCGVRRACRRFAV